MVDSAPNYFFFAAKRNVIQVTEFGEGSSGFGRVLVMVLGGVGHECHLFYSVSIENERYPIKATERWLIFRASYRLNNDVMRGPAYSR